MIQVRAQVNIKNRTRSCSFETDGDSDIQEDDLIRIKKFSYNHIGYDNSVTLNYKITYKTLSNNHGASIGTIKVNNRKELDEAIKHIVKQLNIKNKELNFGGVA